jgi:hypothetical protein
VSSTPIVHSSASARAIGASTAPLRSVGTKRRGVSEPASVSRARDRSAACGPSSTKVSTPIAAIVRTPSAKRTGLRAWRAQYSASAISPPAAAPVTF